MVGHSPLSEGIINARFGRLTVVADSGLRTRSGNKLWFCRCDCGHTTVLPKGALTRGNTKSCGCLRSESITHQNRERSLHKKTESELDPEFSTWSSMIQRCYDPQAPEYALYGGRGVTVCDSWRNSFLAFLRDVGKRPSPRHHLDRHPDKNGHYEPGNVQWVTERGRSTAYVHVEGGKMTLIEFAEKHGVPYKRLWNRYTRGCITPEELLAPPRNRPQ